MPIQGMTLKQDPRDPSKRWIEITRVYDPSTGAMGYPEQFLLTPEQFASFERAGLTPQPIFNDPLRYNQGQFNPTLFQQYVSENPTTNAQGQRYGEADKITQYQQIGQRVLADTSTQTSSRDLGFNTTEQQRLLDYAVGGKFNPQTPGGLNAQIIESARQGNMVDPTVLQAAQEGKDVNAVLQAAGDAERARIEQQNQAQSSTPGQGEVVFLRSPEGNEFQVPVGSDTYNNMIRMGYTQTSTGTGGTGGTGPGGTAGPGTGGGLSGYDLTGLTPEQIAVLQKSEEGLALLAAQGKRLNPDIALSPEMVQRFLDQAKATVTPYYRQLFSQAQADLTKALTRTSEDYAAKERSLGLEYGKALEDTQESYARRGLNFSTDRQRAEQDLARQAQDQLTAAQQAATRQGQDVGTAAERELGTSMLPSSLPKITAGTTPTLGTPGVYGFQTGTGTRDLFNPQGSTTGTLANQQTTAIKEESNYLTNAERELRALDYK